jgi:hypothetical protein
VSHFVGRREPLARLTAAYQASAAGSGGPAAGWPGLVLVTGEAGIGKTALLARFAADVAARGAITIWGTGWDGDQAPAWWPWTQALRALLRRRDDLSTPPDPDLAAVVPELAGTPAVTAPEPQDASRVRVFDAVGRLLTRACAQAPLVVVLDDLQWADRSTMDLLRFVTRHVEPGGLLLVGAYRPHEPRAGVAEVLADLATAGELVALRGLSRDEVADLVSTTFGPTAREWAQAIHERSGGHPFFARELGHLLGTGDAAGEVPAAIRDVIGRRLARLSGDSRALLDAAAVAGTTLLPDVLADLSGDAPVDVAELATEAMASGILVPGGDESALAQFAHDLYRETIYTGLPPARRLDLHHRVAGALLRRHERGSPVFPTELARHFAAAAPLAGSGPALAWARTAADADTARFAFAEAAGHLTRVRSAIAGAGLRLTDGELVDLLTAEADLRLRSGDADAARALLDLAWSRALPTGRPDLLGTVALGMERVGARFAMPRAELIAALDTARHAYAGGGTAAEAQVTAALARQLQHSVPTDRPRAGPLAEDAVAIARRIGDPATLASCLLAQHDTLWTPGTAARRAAIANEIAELATRTHDPERRAQALLLSASAQLESGSAGFRATLAEFQYATERLRQPRHDYVLRTRQAALALLDGDLDAGERLSADAAALGDAVGDSDTGNVYMSQRLEIVRLRADPAELRDTADAAVRWWVGAPAHAHAIAAGFSARAGALDAARRELDTVLALDDWRTDRSYLWSIFVGELAVAAIAVDDRALCNLLLDDLLPLADTCAVNGALVCFMGAHAHRVGLLHAALGSAGPATQWLSRALEVHRRLGTRAWEAETRSALAALDRSGGRRAARAAAAGPGPSSPATRPAAAAEGTVRLQRVGDMWEASYQGRTAYLRDAKGLRDLAALLARPRVDLPALHLAGVDERQRGEPRHADPVLDRTALRAYRRRLAELDEELDAAHVTSDLARGRRASDERERLLAELRRATRPGGASRSLGPSTAERARKAVTARIRDTIRRISAVHPELGAHLERTVRTGGTCRYDPPTR